MNDRPRPDSGPQNAYSYPAGQHAVPHAFATPNKSGRNRREHRHHWAGYTLFAVAAALVIAAVSIQLAAPADTLIEVPTGHRGRGRTEAGLWVLYMPAVMAIFGACIGLGDIAKPRYRHIWRFWWVIVFGIAPAATLWIMAGQIFS